MRILTIMLFVTLVYFPHAGRAGDDIKTAKCWRKWVDDQMKAVPKGSDLVSPATGKEMSQTDGAKRTRDLKYQAKRDALELRGKDNSMWKTFLAECETAN